MRVNHELCIESKRSIYDHDIGYCIRACCSQQCAGVGPSQIDQECSQLVAGTSGQSLQQPDQAPAVPIKDSVKADYLICLGCGAKMKMLKRHINTYHQMTPEEYRKHWGLPADYPTVTVNYSKTPF